MNGFMLQSLDVVDRRILYELDRNARQSNAELGKKIRHSKEFVNFRIKRLEERGIITGYRTMVNTINLGYYPIMIHFKFQNMTPELEKQFGEYFTKDQRTYWVGPMLGPYDFDVGYWIKDISAYKKIQANYMAKFKRVIKDVATLILTEFTTYGRNYLYSTGPKTSFPAILGGKTVIDKIDIKILELLAKNARITITEISQKTGLSPNTIIYRIRNLEKQKIILGYRCNIDTHKLGMVYWKVEFILDDYSRRNQLIEYFALSPYLIYSYHSTGGSDLELEFDTNGYDHLKEIISTAQIKFPGTIREWQAILFPGCLKEAYFPSE